MNRKQGAPKGGRGASAQAGDLTLEATKGGRRPHASEFGSHPHPADGAPAPPHRPPRFAGMRPTAIVLGRRHGIRKYLAQAKEASA